MDYTGQVARTNGFSDVGYLDDEVLARSRTLVQSEGSRLIPSLGFVALVHVLGDPVLAAHQKYLAGFGFSGWNGTIGSASAGSWSAGSAVAR